MTAATNLKLENYNYDYFVTSLFKIIWFNSTKFTPFFASTGFPIPSSLDIHESRKMWSIICFEIPFALSHHLHDAQDTHKKFVHYDHIVSSQERIKCLVRDHVLQL